jgi:hypothetical protein
MLIESARGRYVVFLGGIVPESISVDLQARTFCITRGSSQEKYGIPEEWDIRVSDLKEILQVARADQEDWWEVFHNYKKESKHYKHYNFELRHAGTINFAPCYVQWECNAEGSQRAYGFRGFELEEDHLSGISMGQQMDELLYLIALAEEKAMKEGYVLENRWFVRVLEHETGALVQMRIAASWNKPPRWKAVRL